MGNSESQEEYIEEVADESEVTSGYRVLKVAAGSPADEAGVVPFFDFVVVANGRILVRAAVPV